MFGLWYYIQQYWDKITSVALPDALTYPISFFQNIGYSIAGVIGPFILEPARLLIDFLLGLGYIMQAFFAIIVLIFGLITFPARLLIQVLVLLVYTPISVEPFQFNNQVIVFFKAYPQINSLLIVLWALLFFVGIFNLIRNLGKRLN